MTGSGQFAPSARNIVAVAVPCGALIAVDIWLGVTRDQRPWPMLVSDVALGACFVLAGVVAWRLRPRSRTGLLMLLLGTVMLLANPYGYELAPDTPAATAIGVIGAPMYWLQFALAGHLLLSYPSGRLVRGSPEAALIIGCYALVGVTVGVKAAVHGTGAAAPVTVAVTVAWTALAAVAGGLLLRRFMRAPPLPWTAAFTPTVTPTS
ncbi:hypothetical protein AB0F81_50805, partial [Actinoplanes sp. NPDC024001]|uniref:hypothetical protein n=1 Tax=Actinoplanes sp. NPDC024001 TaxID=3154598 RepID=UPI0033F6146E